MFGEIKTSYKFTFIERKAFGEKYVCAIHLPTFLARDCSGPPGESDEEL